MPPEPVTRKRRKPRASIGTVSPSADRVKQLPLPPPFSPSSSGPDRGESAASIPILTIGHSNQEATAFLSLLRQHGIATVVDVRSAPYSRFAPQFSQDALRGLLDAAGISYLWAGDVLGGRPNDPNCYRGGEIRPGNLDYVAMSKQPWYQSGIAQLMDAGTRGATTVMCSEEDPRRCHRHRLIETSLRERGVMVRHIRGDGTMESLDPAEPWPPAIPSPQLALIGFGT